MATDSNGVWHETLRHEDAPRRSSDRGFGLLFAAVGAAAGVLKLWRGRPVGIWWLIAALALLAVAIFAPRLLGPANRGWQWVALQLSKLFNPVIMAILFFGVLTPISLVMRARRGDPLRLRFDPDAPSYWLARGGEPDGRQTSMHRQF